MPPTQVPDTRDSHMVEDEPESERMNGSAVHDAKPDASAEEAVPTAAGSTSSSYPHIVAPEINNQKQVQFDEQTGKMTVHCVHDRNPSIPDFAPPPYSVATNGTVRRLEEAKQVAPVAEAHPQEQAIEAEVVKPQPQSKSQSFMTGR